MKPRKRALCASYKQLPAIEKNELLTEKSQPIPKQRTFIHAKRL